MSVKSNAPRSVCLEDYNHTDRERRTVAMGITVAAAPRVEDVLRTDDLGAFYDLWRPRIVAFFRSKGLSDADADDLTQTVFVALLVQWDDLSADDREVRLWTVAHRRYVDYVRHNARWRALSLPLTDVADPPCPVADPAAVVVRLDQARHVRLAVEHERPEHQRLLYGRYVEGRRYEDIAGELGTTAGALRNVMSRAHDRLRTRLEAVDVRSLVPSVPWLGWRWTRRSAAPPWVVAAGHGAFVSLVATTLLMAPPSAVPAAAAVEKVADIAALERDAPALATARRSHDSVEARRSTRGTASGRRDSEELDYGKTPVHVPLPRVTIPPIPDPPCVGECELPSQGITIHTPVGDIRKEQNIAPVPCRDIPSPPVVTCHEEPGTQYAVSPPPRPAED